ncbi:hypothetical protein FIU89_05390 [Roseovarius sp. THAF27]|nr:hypothetical protein FIU89_05390 [Roseovarius sp. THAF27]QFT96861.1 hypothetical protein FIU85_06085 [Roseovarius sp. THAF8]
MDRSVTLVLRRAPQRLSAQRNEADVILPR